MLDAAPARSRAGSPATRRRIADVSVFGYAPRGARGRARARRGTSTRGSTACARCPASCTISRPTGRTRGRARAGRSTADVGSPAWAPEGHTTTGGAPPGPGCATAPGARAPARTSARWGSTPTRLDGPIVGIAATWTGTMPCNLNQRELSDAAAAAVDRRRRRPAPVQHDRGLRQPVAGHAGDARLADLARGDRRLDRADDDRARLRRAALHRRLRQDDAGRADGARARRQAGAAALQRPAARGPAATSAS